ncbi:MAG TPA: ATP-binding protein [Bryobacteraceae bacterium]|nr:ATP-binding protein [Bryobacteraceae bacterium]
MARLRVLIIDDELIDREIFKQNLDSDRPGAFIYAEAATGREGLRKLAAFHPDCVLLDFNLPDLDGLRMIRLLHEGRDYLPCAVVMLTGIGNEEIAVEAMKLGVMDYMAKGPASAQALSRTVASAVQRFRLQQEISQQRVALELRNRELEEMRVELFDEKERYRILAEAIPQLVWTADGEGGIHYGNQRLWDFTGRAHTRMCLIESLVHPDDRPALREKWEKSVVSGEPFEVELRVRRAQDQTWRWHLMRTARIRTPDDDPARWFGTFTDIEDQKRAEQAIRQREKLDSVGLLAGGIAHDFNNLLVGIMGGASFAIDTIEPEHASRPMLDIVMRSSERAAQLTQQLLAYAGKIEVFLEPADVGRVVREGCEAARGSLARRIVLEIETSPDIPLIETNAGHLRQVVVNLVVNAAEAIGDNPGVIRVRSATETITAKKPQADALGYELPTGEYVRIEVSDSGPGMSDQMKAQIFDPFFTTKFTGRGLGLAAVQGIVRAMRGAIRVSSSTGDGSTFQVLLPLRTAGRENVPGESMPGESIEDRAELDGALNGMDASDAAG